MEMADIIAITPITRRERKLLTNLHTDLKDHQGCLQMDLRERSPPSIEKKLFIWKKPDNTLLVEITEPDKSIYYGMKDYEEGTQTLDYSERCWMEGLNPAWPQRALKFEKAFLAGHSESDCDAQCTRAYGPSVDTVRTQMLLKQIAIELGGGERVQLMMSSLSCMMDHDAVSVAVRKIGRVSDQYDILETQIDALRVQYGYPTRKEWRDIVNRVPIGSTHFSIQLGVV